jgi:hypothetical protein
MKPIAFRTLDGLRAASRGEFGEDAFRVCLHSLWCDSQRVREGLVRHAAPDHAAWATPCCSASIPAMNPPHVPLVFNILTPALLSHLPELKGRTSVRAARNSHHLLRATA